MDDYWELKFDWLMSYDVYMVVKRGCKKQWYQKVLYSFEYGFMEILLFGNIAY